MAHAADRTSGWRGNAAAGSPALFRSAPLAALFLGISSGFPYAMIGATLTTRLKQDGIDRSTITAFTLAFLVYNLKPFWSWVVDGVRLPLLGRLGQRVSWMLLAGALVIATVAGLGMIDPAANIAGGGDRHDPGRRLPAATSTSSSTPIASNFSSRASSASDRACRNMAGGSARRGRARWRW